MKVPHCVICQQGGGFFTTCHRTVDHHCATNLPDELQIWLTPEPDPGPVYFFAARDQ
jgi:hypothetical protein